MSEFPYHERPFFTEQVAKLNRALALLHQDSPDSEVKTSRGKSDSCSPLAPSAS